MHNTFITLVLMLLLSASSVWAQPFSGALGADIYGTAQGGGNDPAIATPQDDTDILSQPNAVDVNDAINFLLGTSYVHNSDVDFLRYTEEDHLWQDFSDDDFGAGYAMISVSAGNSNSLYVYDVEDPSTLYETVQPVSGFGLTVDGGNNPLYVGRTPFAPGTQFGWALVSSNGVTEDLWDSNSAYNKDGMDHMLTYHLSGLQGKTVSFTIDNETFDYTLKNPYLIVWEDLALNNDGTLGDEDFNDAIYLVDRVAPVPEPASLLLLGGGMLGAMRLRRKNKQI